ncbi:MAG: RND transporter, partial [Sphaerochaeta sp.]|nr:RND transporter [Sphaerochaeta sp.]
MKFDFLAFVGKHSKLTLVFIFLLTLFFLFHAVSLELNGDYASLMQETEDEVVYEGGVGQIPSAGTSTSENSLILDTAVLNTSSTDHQFRASTSFSPISEDDDFEYTSTYLVMVESDNL